MMHILTEQRLCHIEQVTFNSVAGNGVEGEWVKLDGKFDTFKKLAVGEVPDIGACPLYMDASRPDTGGTPIPYNPAHVFVGTVDKVSVLRTWNDKYIVTDQIDVTGLIFGDQLTIKGGQFVKMSAATDPLFGIYRGADPFGFVPNGKVIQLIAQPRFAVVS